jgi:hypothetical protein
MNSMQKNETAERFAGDEHGAPCTANRMDIASSAPLWRERERPLRATVRTHLNPPVMHGCRADLPRSSSRC